jgi:hypothetical protein
MSHTYAILMETSESESESWYYFIRYHGNEEALLHLESQLNQIENYIVPETSIFDLEIKTLVSETTARELTLVELNSVTFHRKFDGLLSKIDFGFIDGDSNITKISRCSDILGYGKIDNFIDDEDIEFSDDDSDDVENISNGSDDGED